MAYSFDLITLPSECDSLIKLAERDKRTIQARKQSLSVRAENSAEDVEGNATELVILNAQLTAVNASVAAMAAGPAKEREITKRLDIELRIRKLNESSDKVGPVTQVEKEYDMEVMDAQVDKMDAFIAAVSAHKATLS